MCMCEFTVVPYTLNLNVLQENLQNLSIGTTQKLKLLKDDWIFFEMVKYTSNIVLYESPPLSFCVLYTMLYVLGGF